MGNRLFKYCGTFSIVIINKSGDINIVGQGKRNDLKEACEDVKKKRKLSEIASDHSTTWVKYHRGLKDLAFTIEETPNEREMDVVVMYGDPNTGKSHKARMLASMYGPYYELPMPDGGQLWWDGYQGEPSIVIDEFTGWIRPAMLNKIMDIYKLKLPIKGGFVNAKFTHVFITSNYEPEDWWHAEKVRWNKQALYRRIHHLYEYRGTSHVDSVIKKIK